MVLPSASSNLPGLSTLASVKAPFTWPKSSLSKRVSVMAPISTGSIFFPHLVDKRCISLANTSLPVPFSPVMRIFASVAATFSTMLLKLFITSLSPQYIALCVSFPQSFPPFLPIALSTAMFLSLASTSVRIIFSFSKGFTMKSAAPSLMPVTASWMSA